MPKPIPRWDMTRVLVQYLVTRQLEKRPVTVKEMSNRMGVGASVIFEMLNKEKIEYTRIPARIGWDSEDRIILTSIPDKLVIQQKLPKEKILEAGEEILMTPFEIKPEEIKLKEMRKEERKRLEREKIRYFLGE